MQGGNNKTGLSKVEVDSGSRSPEGQQAGYTIPAPSSQAGDADGEGGSERPSLG